MVLLLEGRELRCRMSDGGRPPEVSVQTRASNRPGAAVVQKIMVVSNSGKRRSTRASGECREGERKCRSLCVSAPTRRRNQPQHGCQVHGEVSMSSLPEPGKEAVRQERAISSSRDRTGAPLGGSPASVCTGILAARTGCEGSLLPVGPYGVQRARNVAPEGCQGGQLCITRPLQSPRNRSPMSCNSCRTSASEPSIGDWLADARESL